MAEFPTMPGAVDAAWLEAQLGRAGLLGLARIADFTWVAIGTGQVGDTARFNLTYDRPCAAPATLAGKFAAADPTSRGTAAAMSLYVKEVGFYRELAGLIEVRTPRVYAAEIAEDGTDFVLLFEDLAPERGGNQLEGCTLTDAEAAIRQAAALHAATRGHPKVLGADWLHGRDGLLVEIGRLYHQAHTIFRERYDGQLASAAMVLCDLLDTRVEAWLGRQLPDRCLIHGDFRLDNMLFGVGQRDGGSDGEPIAIVDWQTCAVGCGMTDLGYFMGCGIGSDLRRPNEAALLDLYAAEMTRRGVPTTRACLWNRYRLGALHGVFTAVFSAAFVVRTPRGDANFLSMARGACELALDHDSIAALDHFTETGTC
ncbi:MAG: phosphotransferase family protein [Novosphingobium sp.]